MWLVVNLGVSGCRIVTYLQVSLSNSFEDNKVKFFVDKVKKKVGNPVKTVTKFKNVIFEEKSKTLFEHNLKKKR